MERNALQKADFTVFLELWNMTQTYTTPSIHYRMAAWLQNSWNRGDTRLLLTAFRASGKSTITGLFSAWVLWRDPDLRILVLAAEESLASKMVRNIRKIIEKHPLTRHLIPTNPDQWAADRFTINRKKELRDPSVLSAGINSNVTGNRADIIIYDDVEVPNTCGTAEKRLSLRKRIRESNFILVPGGTQLYIGTPHSYFSIYADAPKVELDEEEVFLPNYKRLSLPILDKKNKSIWPEQFSEKDIDILKKQAGPNYFDSQMMLRPVNLLEGRLDVSLLQFYSSDLEYSESQREIQLSINRKKLVSCSAWWDPSFGKISGDDSVFAVVYTDQEGNYYLHHISYIKTDNIQEDEATHQCKLIIKIVEDLFVPSIAIEINGIGRFLPAILRRELAKRNIPCAIIEKTSSKAKHIRILESFDAITAAQSLYVHDSVRQTPFLSEMSEWVPEGKSNDDGLDAVAGALSLEPVRLKRYYHNFSSKWFGNNTAYEANTDFDV